MAFIKDKLGFAKHIFQKIIKQPVVFVNDLDTKLVAEVNIQTACFKE
jgi:hypothetical protein